MKQLRELLAGLDSLPRLAILGLLTGILTAVVIILFRELTELSQNNVLGLSDPDNYEQLALRFLSTRVCLRKVIVQFVRIRASR